MKTSYADMARLTDSERRARMRRFEALARLSERARIDPSFLALPPRARQSDPEPQPRS